jgi:hypothetical protein
MKLSHRNKQVLWALGKVVALTALGTSPAWAGVTGLVTDVKNVYTLISYVPGLVTVSATSVGLGAVMVGGWHIHKRGEREQQGKPVGFVHMAMPIVGGTVLAGVPWVTGSAEKTFENMTSGNASVTAGNSSGNVTVP